MFEFLGFSYQSTSRSMNESFLLIVPWAHFMTTSSVYCLIYVFLSPAGQVDCVFRLRSYSKGDSNLGIQVL